MASGTKSGQLPVGCSNWGIWDSTDHRDELGTLNLLTADVKAAAATEVREGISVSLK